MEQLNLQLILNTNGSITAKWDAISKTERYDAYMFPVGADYMICRDKNLQTTSYTSPANLPANKQYDVVVIAYRSDDSLEKISDGARILIRSDFYNNIPPDVPQNVKAVADTVSVTVSFDKVSRATSYDILFDNVVYNVTNTSKKFTGLSSKTTHTYAVRARSSTMTSAYSTTNSITTDAKLPAIPKNIRKSVSGSDATIYWDAVPSATIYDILFDGKLYSLAGTSKTFPQLKVGAKYVFQIRAKNADGYSAFTNQQTVTMAPKAPTTINATCTDDTIQVSWDKVADAVGYQVRFNYTPYQVLGTSIEFTGLEPNTSYFCQIASKSEDGIGFSNSGKTIKTLLPLPNAPIGMTNMSTENAVTVKWDAVADATSYEVLFNGTVYKVLNTERKFTGLSANTVYSYQVRSINANGVGEYSEVYTVQTAPLAPSNAKISCDEKSVTISWDAIEGATSYDVLFDGKVYNVTDTCITFTELSANASYVYKIRVNNQDGSSSYSDSKTIQTAPNSPMTINATATKNSVKLWWSAIVGATSYDVLFNGVVYRVTGTSKTFTELSAGTTYEYAVRSNHSNGSSSYCETRSITTLPMAPSVPSNITAKATVDSVTIRWDAVNEATSYDIVFNGVRYTVEDTFKTFTGLLMNKSYTYKVRAKNAGGNSDYSSSMTVKTLITTPAAPISVTGTTTSYSLTVKWNTVNGATGYDLLVDGVLYSTNATSMTVNDLMPNTSHTFCVRAKNSVGISDYSDEYTMNTKVAPPTNVIATATEDTITISWDEVDGALGYSVMFNEKIYDLVGTSKTFEGLSHSTEYSYAVCGKNVYGFGDYCDTATITTLNPYPSVPTNVTATATFNSVIISWDAMEYTDGYEVEFNGVNYASASAAPMLLSARAISNSSASTMMVFTPLEPNTEYTYRVRGVNERGVGEYSPLATIKTDITKSATLPSMASNTKNSYLDGKIAHTALDPVNALTGAFLWSYTFLENQGKDKLHFTVMYDSQRHSQSRCLGMKWTHALNYLLFKDEEYVYFCTPNDEVLAFTINEDGTYKAVHSHFELTRTEEQGYLVKALDGTQYVFDSKMCLQHIVEAGLVAYQFTSDSQGHITAITSRHGETLTLAYADDKITSVTDVMGNSVIFIYEEDFLSAVTNSDGNTMNFYYDSKGNLLMIMDFAGDRYLSNLYDEYDRIVAQYTEGRGTSYASYDDVNRVTIFTDEAGNETKHYYDENGRITDVECAGNTVHTEYGSSGRVLSQTDSLGHTTQMEYDQYGRMVHVVYPDGTEEWLYYNDRNYPTGVINREGTYYTYTYDDNNNLTLAVDERGNPSFYKYDENDNLISYIDKRCSEWKYAYDANNHLQQAVDPDGNIYQYTHDEIGRLTSYTAPSGRTITYKYSATGQLLEMTDADGTVVFTYNENGNNTGVTDRMGNSQRLEYNAMGQVALVTDYMGNEYHFDYDAIGSLIQETDPLGYSKSYTYDGLGNRTSVTDANGATTNYTFNAGSQLTEVKDPMGNMVKYAYNTMGQITVVTDALENQTCYGYDEMGRLITELDALSNTVRYTYNESGDLLSKTDAEGNVIRYDYDSEHHVRRIHTADGTTEINYDAMGRVISVEDVNGHFEKTSYNADSNVSGYTDKEGNITTYAYDKSGRIAEKTDANGGKTAYEYDKNGNCTKVTNAEGHVFLYEYNANNRLVKETNPLGYATTYEYDARGALVSVVDAKGGKRTFTYDGNGNLVTETNPLGGVITYTYDALNRLVKVVDEEDHICTYEYDANSNMISYTDANENQWKYQYDAINRLISVDDQNGGCLALVYTKTGKIKKITDQEGAETSYTYDALGRLTEMSDALNNKLSFTYDGMGRMLTQTDALGNVTAYEYSPSGNLLSIKNPEGDTITYTYNSMGQVATETNGLGQTTTYEYDSLGQVLSITDAEGDVTTFTYTANAQVETATDADGNTTQYQYDACGNLAQIIDPLGNVTAFEYDAMNNQIKECVSTSEEQLCTTIYQYDKKGRMIRIINPLLDEKVYTYDGNDNVVTILDEDQNETSIRYDLNNKPVQMCYSDGKQAVFRYNKRGELVELQDWNGLTTFAYGKTGKLERVIDHNQRSTAYRYDANGNRTGMDYPDGSMVQFTYDRNNRMTKVVDAELNTTQYGYDAAGNITSLIQPDSSATYTYNGKGLPSVVAYAFDDGTTMEQHYSYNARGNIIGVENIGNTSVLTGNIAYNYDALGRLLSCTDGQMTEAYEYDTLGNRIAKQVNGNQTATYQYNAWNQLIGKSENNRQYSYGYDKRGNLTEERCGDALVKQYLYDATNHMSQGRNLETGEQTEYGYNALYMRVKNAQTLLNRPSSYQSGSVSTATDTPFRTREVHYVNDYLSGANNELMAYKEGYGALRVTYGHSYERLGQKITLDADAPSNVRTNIASTHNGQAYFQPNIQGSVLFATNAQGDILRYGERNVWGNLKLPMVDDVNASGLEDSFRFTNYCYDPVIEKYFAQARFYDGTQGRMLAPDPVKRSLNGYTYCENNPVDCVDPTGEVLNVLAGAVIGGVAGFAGSAVSQLISGQKFDSKKAWGAAANGAIVGGVKGALVSSGVGAGVALAADFAAGTLGSAAEQKITTGKVDVGRSVVSGVTNAVSGAIYGNSAIKTLGQAVGKGAAAGAATSGINYIYDALTSGNSSSQYGGDGLRRSYSSVTTIDPRGNCGTTNKLGLMTTTTSTYGYQYSSPQTEQRSNFSFSGFVASVATGAALGGLSSALFYGAGKAVEVVKSGIASRTRNTQTVVVEDEAQTRLKYDLQFFGNKKSGNSGKYQKAGLWERLTTRKANVSDLYANPMDEFSNPRIGPSESAVSRYIKEINTTGKLSTPIEVQKLSAGGYEIVNGHHRWLAAKKTSLNKVPIRIKNYNN